MQHWVLEEAWDENYFRPDFLGPKHLIHSIEWGLPLVATMIEGLPASPRWRMNGVGATEALFSILNDAIGSREATWIFVSNPDNAVSILKAAYPATSEGSAVRNLWLFETNSVDEGGNQHLALIFEDRSGAVVFTREFVRFSGFEIAFYGADETWSQLSSALGITE